MNRAWPLLALWALIPLTWGEFALRILWPALSQPRWPYPAYWVAARLVWEGHPELIYGDPAAFVRESARLGAVPDLFDANMPTTVLPFLPLGSLTQNTAHILWLLFSLACFLAGFWLLLRALRLPDSVRLGLWALAPIFHPWRDDIARAQAYPLVFLLTVLGAAYALRAGESKASRRAALLAGVAYGLLCIVKLYYGAVLLLPALVRRQWTTVVAAGGVFGLAALGTVLWWRRGLWADAIRTGFTWRERPETALTAYQTLNGLLMHLLRYDATLNPGPILRLPELVAPLWWAAALTAVAGSFWALSRERLLLDATSAERLLAPALAIPLALILAPVAEEDHFVLALFPLAVVGAILWERRSGVGAQIVFLVAVVLLGAPWHFNVPSVAGWAALLHYPRLYGALLLFGLILVYLSRPREARASRISPAASAWPRAFQWVSRRK